MNGKCWTCHRLYGSPLKLACPLHNSGVPQFSWPICFPWGRVTPSAQTGSFEFTACSSCFPIQRLLTYGPVCFRHYIIQLTTTSCSPSIRQETQRNVSIQRQSLPPRSHQAFQSASALWTTSAPAGPLHYVALSPLVTRLHVYCYIVRIYC